MYGEDATKVLAEVSFRVVKPCLSGNMCCGSSAACAVVGMNRAAREHVKVLPWNTGKPVAV